MPFYVFFAVIAFPVLFVMVTWVIVTAYRLYVPEEPQAFAAEERRWHMILAEQGQAMLVCARDIRADVRYRERHGHEREYRYAASGSSGVPFNWVEDLALRCN